jgi:hypothetical protein
MFKRLSRCILAQAIAVRGLIVTAIGQVRGWLRGWRLDCGKFARSLADWRHLLSCQSVPVSSDVQSAL